MGVVNVTPDSFFDGGRHNLPGDAARRCFQLVEEGADLLDLGGESTRPGARPVDESEELGRVLPVLDAIKNRLSVPVSIDTRKASVAEAALNAGADLVNDVSALADPKMAEVVARHQAGLVLMHMRGVPANMQSIPPSPDILGEIRDHLKRTLETAYSHDIQRDRILLDPGIGFGKTVEDNLKILHRLPFLEDFDLPLLVGASRKSFLGAILRASEDDRLWGTAASVAIAIWRGAHVVRVHDVREMRMVADVTDALMAESLT